MIRDTFSPDPRNECLEAYLNTTASAELNRYNAHLSDFGVHLRGHITYVEGEVARVQELQAQRNASRAVGSKQRFASFWSLELPQSPPPANSPCPRSRRGVVDVALEEGVDGEEDAKVKAQKQRIERLRREGWVVRKERHGFRGGAFYDELCRRVEAELTGEYY